MGNLAGLEIELEATVGMIPPQRRIRKIIQNFEGMRNHALFLTLEYDGNHS